MKRFVLIGLVVIFAKLSSVYADNLKLDHHDGSSTTKIYTFGGTFMINRLKDLAGKIIYRNVPAENETEFSKEYMGEPYELFSYNENIMELKNSDKKSILLSRDLWDDGNWKEYTPPIKYSYFPFKQKDENCCHCCEICNKKNKNRFGLIKTGWHPYGLEDTDSYPSEYECPICNTPLRRSLNVYKRGDDYRFCRKCKIGFRLVGK